MREIDAPIELKNAAEAFCLRSWLLIFGPGRCIWSKFAMNSAESQPINWTRWPTLQQPFPAWITIKRWTDRRCDRTTVPCSPINRRRTTCRCTIWCVRIRLRLTSSTRSSLSMRRSSSRGTVPCSTSCFFRFSPFSKCFALTPKKWPPKRSFCTPFLNSDTWMIVWFNTFNLLPNRPTEKAFITLSTEASPPCNSFQDAVYFAPFGRWPTICLYTRFESWKRPSQWHCLPVPSVSYIFCHGCFCINSLSEFG